MDTVAIERTRKYFSFGWSRFGKNEIGRKWYKDSFSYMRSVPGEIFRRGRSLGLDAGCGSGSDMLHISSLYGSRIVGIDISDSLKVTRDNIRGRDGLHAAQASIYALPFKDGLFDFAYSFGVLHHLPEPEQAFHCICSTVRKGGAVLIYVYEDFSQRSSLERLLLKAVNTIRFFTTRMPPFFLHILTVVMAPAVLLCCSLPSRALDAIPVLRRIACRIPFRHTTRLDCIIADLYDRFSAPIEIRYNRSQIIEWFTRARCTGITAVYYRGWVVWGTRT